MRTTDVSEVPPLLPVGLPGPQAQWAGEPPAPRPPARTARAAADESLRKPRPKSAAPRWPQRIRGSRHEHQLLAQTLLLSLLVHTLLLGLIFGGQEHG